MHGHSTDDDTMSDTRKHHGQRLKVVFIAGAGRSGSTLLGQLLGQVDDWFAAGEVFFLWDRLIENSACGCNEPVHSCPIWSQVAKGSSALSRDDLQELIDARDSLKVRPQGLAGGEIRFRNLWRRLSGRRMIHKPEQVQQLGKQLGRAFQTLADITGARVIVDTSKSSAHGYILRQIETIDLYEVHLVRDSRAVAYSWRKGGKLYDVLDGKPRHFPQRSTIASMADWVWSNMSAESLFPSGMRSEYYQRVRYEDVVKSPRQTITRIVENIDSKSTFSFINQDETVKLESNHMVAGNPSRFSQGSIRLKQDEEWRTRLPFGQKTLALATSFPWMLRYRYLV